MSEKKYIDDTIDKLSRSIKAATSNIIGAPDKIIITYDSARQIATCLDWLQAIFKQNIDSLSVNDVSIKNLPDYLRKGYLMCKFCDSLAERKERENWYGHSDPELGRWMQEYTVALVIHSWYQKCGKKSASRTVDFRNNGLGYKLNYCPECGKKYKAGLFDNE